MISSPSSNAQPTQRRQDSEDQPRFTLTTSAPVLGSASGPSSSSSGGFGFPTSSSAVFGVPPSAGATTPTHGMMNVEEGSSTSHASSSRLGTSTTTNPATSSRQQLYQPLSLADALSRANDDATRALDEVLAERNKFCLEATKLGSENVRIWNLVRRIKKENEELKSSTRSGTSSTTNAAPHTQPAYGTLSPSPSGMGQEMYDNSTSSSPGIGNLISSSKGSPLVSPGGSNQSTGRQVKGSDLPLSTVVNQNPAMTPSALVSNPPSAPISSSTENQTSTPVINGSQSGHGIPVPQSPPSSSTAQQSLYSPRDLLQSPQQTSIMQQRAAAQAQRLAALASPTEGQGSSGRNSLEGQEFEAIDGSSVANSEEDGIENGEVAANEGTKATKEAQTVPTTQVSRFQELTRTSSSSTSERRALSSDSLSLASSSSPRLDANMLPYVNVSVLGTNLQSNDRGKDDVSFYVSVDLRAPPSGVKLNTASWRLEKNFSDILALDARLKQKHGKSKNVVKRISAAELPDRSLFKDHAPSKVDKRKVMLEVYLQNLLAISLPDKDDFCTFLCTDAIRVKPKDPNATTKEGFLTKKGANLGRWVTRLYVLSSSTLDYFETRGGPHLGSINIVGAQIGRQQRSDIASAEKDMDENSYRHAFLILESKPSLAAGEQKQMVRHVLCAESDEERDDWVDVLVRAIAAIASTPTNKNNKNYVLPSRTFSDSSMTTPVSPTNPAIRNVGRPELKDSSIISRGGIRGDGGGVGTGGVPNSGVAPLTLSPRQGTHSLRPTEAPPTSHLNASPIGSYPTSPSGGPSIHSSTSTTDQIRAQPEFGRYSIDDQYNNNNSAKFSNQLPPNVPQTQPLFSQQNSLQSAQPLQLQQPAMIVPHQQQQQVPSRSRSTTQDQIISAPNSSITGDQTNSGPSQMTESTSSTSAVANPSGKERNHSRPAISGPMNGTTIPVGYKFGGGKEETSSGPDTKKRFWHRFGGAGSSNDKANQPKKVFGVSLADSIAVSNVSEGLELPSVVYRCIEYLEKKNAAMEEGIYRLSGSSNVIKNLRERFNTQGDVNLLAPSEPYYDPHAIAGLLKQFLRELTNSVLTRELHFDFMRVNDIVDRKERVNELGHLVSLLPLANYSLLRTLCSHLIKVIELSDVNKMTMRNVGIVFSPTLGIPGGVFALFLTEFDWVFFTDAKGEPAPKQMEEDIIAPDSAELGKTSEEQWQDLHHQQQQQRQKRRDLSPPDDQEQPQAQQEAQSPGRVGQGNHKNRSSWISGNALHSGDGRVVMSLQQQNRDNRNSLSYNEMEADKLLGGPQNRYRLTSHHEEMEAMMGSTPAEIYDANESFQSQEEAPPELSGIEDHAALASPSMSATHIQASPRTASRKLHNHNNLALNRSALNNDIYPRPNESNPTTPTSPTSSMRTGRTTQTTQNPRYGPGQTTNYNSNGFNEGI